MPMKEHAKTPLIASGGIRLQLQARPQQNRARSSHRGVLSARHTPRSTLCRSNRVQDCQSAAGIIRWHHRLMRRRPTLAPSAGFSYRTSRGESANLDVIRAPYVLYGVKYIAPVALVTHRMCDGCFQIWYSTCDQPGRCHQNQIRNQNPEVRPHVRWRG